MGVERKSLTNLQLELLKIFERDVPEKDLLAIRKFLIQYFAKQVMDLADEAWEKNNWTTEDEQRFLHEHYRKSQHP